MRDQKKFLEKVAALLAGESVTDLSKTVVVFPNHRSGIFLKKYLMEALPRNSWLPEILTIDELMMALSGLNAADAVVVDFELYQIHRVIEGEKARPLEDFLNWAPLMINDFSDIDYYLANAKTLFSELTDIKALERWNLGEKPLTEIQKNYLKFFQSLFTYYSRLQKSLLEKNLAYKAMAYRRVAENYDSVKKAIRWEHFVFAGFNALTESEKQLMTALKNDYRFDYLVDADTFYFENRRHPHEASRFIRQALKSLKISDPAWVEDHLTRDPKTLEVVGVPKYVGQVAFAAQTLQRWFSDSHYDPAGTLVVLGEEDLLIPLLNAVPVKTGNGSALQYNVSLGYPLKDGPLAHFILAWLEMLVLREEDPAHRIPVASLLTLLRSPVMEMLGRGAETLSLMKSIPGFFVEARELYQMDFSEDTRSLMEVLFGKLKKPADFLFQLGTFLQLLQAGPEFREKTGALLQSQLVLVFRLTKVLEGMLKEQAAVLNFRALQKIVAQVLNRQEVSLKGEPLTGVQIMGMLETRSLDFENVIIIGANEGILPKTGFSESFIPFDLRRNHGLPLPNTKSAIFSYYFFRLLQRAQHVVYLFNSEPDVFGNGEPSRFIRQVEHELAGKNPNLTFKKQWVNTPLRDHDLKSEITVEKTGEVLPRLKALAESGISPSALNSFIRCSLQFYLKYVLKIEPPDPVETSVQSDTFGSVVHGVLERLYKPFAGQKILPEVLESQMAAVGTILKENFDKYYGVHDLNYGKNLLIFEVAKAYVERFIQNDLINLQTTERHLEGVELGYKALFSFAGGKVNIKGIIDRVDRIPGEPGIRILDYKTGTVREADLKIKDWDALITEDKYSKAFQVLTYAWLYRAVNPGVSQLNAGLISMKSASGKPAEVVLPEGAALHDAMPEFENLLNRLLTALFDENKPFEQTSDPERCTYCDFKNMCNR